MYITTACVVFRIVGRGIVHRDSRHSLSRASRFSLDRERWRQLREEDGGRKMAVEKAREGNKKAGGGARGPMVTSQSVISL